MPFKLPLVRCKWNRKDETVLFRQRGRPLSRELLIYKWIDWDAFKSLKDKQRLRKTRKNNKMNWHYTTWRTVSSAGPGPFCCTPCLRVEQKSLAALRLTSVTEQLLISFLSPLFLLKSYLCSVCFTFVSFAEPTSLSSAPRIANKAVVATVFSIQRSSKLIIIFDILFMLLAIKLQDRKFDFFSLFAL